MDTIAEAEHPRSCLEPLDGNSRAAQDVAHK